MAGPEKTSAIVLKTQKWSETSKIAHLYTQRWGRISVLAKGAMRPKAKFWGHLETFSLVEAMVYKKPREQLQLLSQCLLMDPFGELYTDPERAGYAFAVVEFLERHTLEESNNNLFEWTVFNFHLWRDLSGSRLRLAFFEYLLIALAHLGYRPAIEGCRSCGLEPAAGQKVMFDQAGGGLICRRCAGENSTHLVLSAAAYLRVKNAVCGSIEWNSAECPPPSVVNEIIDLIESFYGYHLGGRRLKALDFARRVARPDQTD